MPHCYTLTARTAHWYHNAKLLFLSLILLSLCQLAWAQSYMVNTNGDSHATTPAAGTGLDNNGFISLRSAIEAATQTAGSHTITFNPAIGNTINLSLGQVTVGNAGLGNNITIVGPGKNLLTINQTTINRVFSTGTGAVTFTLSGLTLNYTGPTTDVISGGGGAIIAGGAGASTTLTDVAINNFHIQLGNGGAISQSSSSNIHSLTITNCSFSNNYCGGAGGAVSYNGLGSCTITNSTFSGNQTGPITGPTGSNTGGDGGAVSVTGSGNGGTYLVEKNTFLNNHALNTTAHAGAVMGTNGTLTLRFNRFIGNNTSNTSSLPLAQVVAQAGGSTVNTTIADNNWWGVNTGPATNDAAALAAGGTLTLTKWLQLKTAASPNAICPTNVGPGNTSLVTATFLKNSAGEDISTANLSALIGLPITFSATLGTLSGAQSSIQSSGTATVTFTSNGTPGNGSVNAVVDNVPGNDATAKANITIYDPAHFTGQPSPLTVCKGSNASFTATAAGTPAPTYQWRIGTAPLTEGTKYQGVTTSTLTITDAQPADELSNYNVVISNTCATVTSNSVALTVNPIPDVNAISNATYCSGENLSAVHFTGSVPGTVFSWTKSGAAIGSGSSGTGDIPAFTATNAGTAPATATFTVTPAYTQNGITCTGSAIQFTITVNPVPSVDNVTDLTYCNGASVSSVVFTGNVPGTVFSWTRTAANIGLATTSGTGPVPAFTATIAGSSPVSSTFTVTPSYTNNGKTCTGTPIQFTLTVQPNSATPAVNAPLCSGLTTVSGTSTEANGTTITVYSNGSPVGTGTVSGGLWTASVTPLVSGASITAKATASQKCISEASAVVTVGTSASTTTTVSSGNNPSFTASPGNSVTFTATVTSSSPVTTGTVTFKEGATILSGNVALNGSGTASFTTNFGTEGNHVITAQYNGGCPYLPSTGSIVQTVNNHTSVNGNVFCNDQSAITVNDASVASPYPSNIFVSGMGTGITNLKVHINGFSHPATNDVDVLLVGPGGQKLVLFSDAGNAGASNINLVFDDAAATQLPLAGALVSGTFKPTDPSAGDVFPAPAPSAPNYPAPAGAATLSSIFGGIDPNGTWSLYVVDDNGNNAGSISGWCVEITSCVLTCPDNIMVTTGTGNTQCGTTVNFSATTTGNCGTVSYVDQNGHPVHSGDFFPVGTTTVAATGGGAQCSFSITVNDNTPPAITCPAGQTANAGINCQAAVPNFVATTLVTDNCSSPASITITQLPVAGTLVGLGPTTVTLTAIDAAGNQSQCTTSFTVHDATAPEITCPANIITSAASNSCSATVHFTMPTPTDACGAATASATRGDGLSLNDPYPLGTTTITLTATDGADNTAQCTFTITVNDVTAPTIVCPAPLQAYAGPTCMVPVPNFVSATTASDNCTSPGDITITQSPAAGTLVSAGQTTITLTAKDASNNTAQCTTTFSVVDNTPPSITCPAGTSAVANSSCQAPVPNYVASAVVNDNCTSSGSISVTQSPAAGTMVGVGQTTVTLTATDAANNQSQCTTTFTVLDQTPPSFTTALTANPVVLWPPDHKLRDITLTYATSDNCGTVTNQVTVTSTDPISGVSDGDKFPDWIITDDHHLQLRAERGNGRDARIYTITVTPVDASGNSGTPQSVNVYIAHNITAPVTGTPFKIGSTVNFAGVFWDKPGNKHTAQWTIDDNTTVKGLVTEPSGSKNGKVTGAYKFAAAGVYRLQMNITDQNKLVSYCNTNEDLEEIVVIYDPNGGYAFGGGSFNSPAGALLSNPDVTGKASYGFTVTYFKGATLPKGETQFQFKVGDFEFNALNFDYLSVAGAKAVFAGSGKIIGGQSGVNFTMYVIDGALDGTGVDKVRLKIYNKNTGQVFYDSQPGAGETANPSLPVNAASTVVIGGTGNSARQDQSAGNTLAASLQLRAYPNPSSGSFNVVVATSNYTGKISLRVIDVLGREVERKTVTPNQVVNLGAQYRPGIYIVQVSQGSEVTETKLNKIPD